MRGASGGSSLRRRATSGGSEGLEAGDDGVARGRADGALAEVDVEEGISDGGDVRGGDDLAFCEKIDGAVWEEPHDHFGFVRQIGAKALDAGLVEGVAPRGDETDLRMLGLSVDAAARSALFERGNTCSSRAVTNVPVDTFRTSVIRISVVRFCALTAARRAARASADGSIENTGLT